MFTKLTEDDWPAHPGYDDKDPHTDSVAGNLVARRADIEVLGYITDAEALYSYHDFAFIRLDGFGYMLETSGCSCPSPKDTWCVTVGPVSAAELRAAVEAKRDDYGPTARQWSEFEEMFAAAEAAG